MKHAPSHNTRTPKGTKFQKRKRLSLLVHIVELSAKSILSLFCLKRSPLVCCFVSCYFIPAFSCPAFSRPSFSCPAISCPAHWSANFMSYNFMPCKLVRQFHVRHFHVQHFQRPPPARHFFPPHL